jgi:hypothetical protein
MQPTFDGHRHDTYILLLSESGPKLTGQKSVRIFAHFAAGRIQAVDSVVRWPALEEPHFCADTRVRDFSLELKACSKISSRTDSQSEDFTYPKYRRFTWRRLSRQGLTTDIDFQARHSGRADESLNGSELLSKTAKSAILPI